MDGLSREALEAFGESYEDFFRTRGGFVINTGSGRRLLTKTEERPEHIMFSHQIKEAITEKGLGPSDSFCLTEKGLPYYELKGQVYVLCKLCPGKPIDLSQEGQFILLLEELAKLHYFLKETQIPGEAFLGPDLLKTLKRAKQELARRKKTAGSKSMSDFDIMFLRNYPHYIERLKDSLQILEQSAYADKLQKAYKNNGICHNYLKKENIFIDSQRAYISNFSKAAADYYICDLAALIKRYYKYSGENRLPIESIIDRYNAHNPIAKDEISALYAMLLYPEDFVKASCAYYLKKRSFIPGALYKKLAEALCVKEGLLEYIEALKAYC